MKNRELQIKFYVWRIEKFFFALCFFCGALSFVQAQSINQSYPTPITSNEISGKIAARDLGDARLTAYYYAFDGAQGDIFINVESERRHRRFHRRQSPTFDENHDLRRRFG
jgi:hypothetical protein